MKYIETIGDVSRTYEGTAEEIVNLINKLDYTSDQKEEPAFPPRYKHQNCRFNMDVEIDQFNK